MQDSREQKREEKLKNFNENENGLRDFGIFGLPFEAEESELVLVPVPWEATVSYAKGTASGPKAIKDASLQIDLYNPSFPDLWRLGIAIEDEDKGVVKQNQKIRKKVEKYLEKYIKGKVDEGLLQEINASCLSLKESIKSKTSKILDQGKIVGLVGGDHSTPLGYLEALAERHESFGVLHIDAHADLREAYEGFTYSHASIFYNALKIKNLTKLVQVGIRDFSKGEQEVIENESGRVEVFTEYGLRKKLFEGATWASVCDQIVARLPEKVYISFDIDGLLPHLSPNTGTPVMGGFSMEELIYLFEKVLGAGKKIIGFDLSEVAPGEDEWDGNVGARVLYQLSLLMLKSKQNG